MLRDSGPAGIEPATCKSQVQRPTTEPPRNTNLRLTISGTYVYDKILDRVLEQLKCHSAQP